MHKKLPTPIQKRGESSIIYSIFDNVGILTTPILVEVARIRVEAAASKPRDAIPVNERLRAYFIVYFHQRKAQ